jgi:predicted nucleic-acid-binding protein
LIGLDTNVLLRFTVGDDPVQAASARDALAQLTQDNRGFINLIVLAEFVWALRAAYRKSREEIAQSLQALLDAQELQFEQEDLVVLALALYRRTWADFADCLIALVNAGHGCTATLTFDHDAASLPNISVIGRR